MFVYIFVKANRELSLPLLSIVGQTTPGMVKTKRCSAKAAEGFIPSGGNPGDFFVTSVWMFCQA